MTMAISTLHNRELYVIAQWGPRPESAEALATRWLALITRLQTLHPLLAKWTHDDDDRGLVPFDPRLEAQIIRVLDQTTRTRDGTLFPRAGTSMWTTTEPCPPQDGFAIKMYAGRDYTGNQITGHTDYFAVPNPAFVRYDFLRGVMLAAAETFEARQARVYPDDLRRLWTNPRGIGDELDLAWISWIAPRFAPLVTPPSSAIVERRPDGGLLMAATRETFSTDNPAHLAVAHEIKSALAPYNAVPWTPEAGKT